MPRYYRGVIFMAVILPPRKCSGSIPGFPFVVALLLCIFVILYVCFLTSASANKQKLHNNFTKLPLQSLPRSLRRGSRFWVPGLEFGWKVGRWEGVIGQCANGCRCCHKSLSHYVTIQTVVGRRTFVVCLYCCWLLTPDTWFLNLSSWLLAPDS